MQRTRGASAAGGNEADVPAESTCASAGHARAESGHRSAGSPKGAYADGHAESGQHPARGAPWIGASAGV